MGRPDFGIKTVLLLPGRVGVVDLEPGRPLGVVALLVGVPARLLGVILPVGVEDLAGELLFTPPILLLGVVLRGECAPFRDD